MTLREAEEDGVRAMRGKNALTLEAMRALSPDSLLKGDYRRLPVVDGYLLPDQVDGLFKKGAINKVDLSAAQVISFAKRNYGTRADFFLTLYPAGTVQSQQALGRDLHFGWVHYMPLPGILTGKGFHPGPRFPPKKPRSFGSVIPWRQSTFRRCAPLVSSSLIPGECTSPWIFDKRLSGPYDTIFEPLSY
jgi:hypothetical protein